MKPVMQFEPFDLDGYHIHKIIGKGEFGRVYLATDKNNFEVAIKEISKSQLRASRKRQQLFETERTILQRVRNDNVVRLYDCIDKPNHHYLVMEYCKYGDLHDYIKGKPTSTLTEEEALNILVQILNGFKGLHQILVIHRDIKLRNILVAEGEKIKIADFGLSKISQQGIATTIVGTPYTKAPEVFNGKRYDNKADIWSLGVIFYQMLFRLSYPYTAKNEKALFDGIKQGKSIDFRAHGILISEETQQLIRRMLTPDPKKRITWKQLGQHKLLLKVMQKVGMRSGGPSSDYYEKMQGFMEEYNELNIRLVIYFETLVSLERLRQRNQQFSQINTLYYQFMLTKAMRVLFDRIRVLIQKCLEVSSVGDALNEVALKEQQAQVECYYEQALGNLQLYLMERGQEPESALADQMAGGKLNQKLFRDYTLKLYKIFERKVTQFEQVPIMQKALLDQMRNILFSLHGQPNEFVDTVEGLKTCIRQMFSKVTEIEEPSPKK